MNKPMLVVLGGSVTALGVARGASQIGFSVSLVDTRDDVAMHTNVGCVKILANKNEKKFYNQSYLLESMVIII